MRSDRHHVIELLPSAARTATAASSKQTNRGYSGVLVCLDVTSGGGAGGLHVRIRGYDAYGGAYLLNASPPAVLTTTKKAYLLYPSATAASGDVAQATTIPLPHEWDVQVTADDATSHTYRVSAVLIP